MKKQILVMNMSRHTSVFTEIMVIVHGKSEYEICSYIKSNLKIKMEIIAQKKGKNSIQINSLKNILGNITFKNKKNFLNEYNDIRSDTKKNILNFKLFMIMDTDDCTAEDVENYMDKSMFINHWLYDFIIPIYNIKDLEDVLKKAGIPYETKDKGNYVNIFPTNRGKADIQQVQEFDSKIKSACMISNLSIFIEKCLEVQKKYNEF